MIGSRGDILNIKLSHNVHRPIFTVLLVRDSVFLCFGQFCEVVGLPIIHPQEDLAKFDYTLKRTVEKFRNHATRLATCYNLSMKEGSLFCFVL